MKNNTLFYGKVKNAISKTNVKVGRFLAFTVFVLSFIVGANANPVDKVRARQVATTFLNNNGARTSGLTDVSSVVGFSNVYVFTTENSFVLMSADDCVQPILGYSLTGRFDFENMPDNKRAWIQGYTEEIRYAVDNRLRASSEVLQQWRDLAEGNPNAGRATTAVAPLLQTQWNQGSPYNMLCPGGSVTGCVATAMAQIMKYWNYPTHGIGSHSYTHPTYGELSADFNSTTYDWNNMTNTYSGSSSNAQKMAVATLMYHCGVAVNMNYSPSASGAATADVAIALKTYFNYSSDVQSYSRSDYSETAWINMLKSDLDQNRPVQYSGSGSGGGHSFVFDGYNSNNYFHVNWGWGGYCDEYYTINNLNPGPGGIGSGSNGIYNDYQEAVLGIHPSESTASVPSNLTCSQNGRNVTLSWSAAAGASSYKVYRNSCLVGNATSTSYADIAPYGNSVYYVRSVDSQGRLSLSSNAVTVTVDYPMPLVDDLAATVSGNNVNLTWTAPDWCFPATPTATLSYGEGDVNYRWTSVYYAHRYLAADLAQYANKAVYKVATFVLYPGTYSAYVYTRSTSNNQPDATACAMAKEGIEVTMPGWFEFDADAPIFLSQGNDLWVVMKQENTGQSFPTPSFNLSSHNTNAFYAGNYSPTSLSDTHSSYNCAWFIKAYITDGNYTYSIFRNNARIANNVSGTSYTNTNLASGVYNYYVKTNYYAGESAASNQVSVQIGSGTLNTISASASPNEGGTITGAGTYFSGQTCTLNAIANEGYYFENWTKNGSVVSTNASYSFTVIGDATYVANFNSSDLHVFATYYPDANNPNSQYVRVFWTGPTSGKDNPRSTYSVYRARCDGSQEVLIAENVTGNQYIDYGWSTLTEGNYKYGVLVENGKGRSSEIQWNDSPVAINNHTIDVTYFENPVANNITQGEPSQLNNRDGWLYYDNGTYATSVGAGGSLYWGTMFPTASLAPYIGTNLTKVAIFTSYACSATLNVYVGGAQPGGSPAATQTFTMAGDQEFMEITLNNPVPVDGTQNLWITFYQSGESYPADACNDTGDANNRWVSIDGANWMDLASAGLPGYGWMIRAYVEDVAAETVWSDCIEKPSMAQQSIMLSEGWNWWSSYIELDGIDALAMLEESLGGKGLVIKSQDAYVEYSSSTGTWAGSLLSIDNASGYKIKMAEACKSIINGPIAMSVNHPITLNQGWNWISYTASQPQTVTSALTGFSPATGDVIKGQNAYATYSAGTGWTPSNFPLIPGECYMYYSSTAGVKTLIINQAGSK